MHEKLLKIQQEIGSIKKDATNPFFKSKYFDINSLLEQIKPILNKHEVVVLQALTNIDGRPALKTTLMGKAENLSETVTLPDLQDPQKFGSAVTYYRRYALQSLLALEAEDDDGNLASKPKTPSQKPKTAPQEPVNSLDDIFA